MVSQKRGAATVAQREDGQPVKKARTTTSKSKQAKAAGACSLTKKEIGDNVHSMLALHKYGLNRTRFEMKMDIPFFRSFFIANDKLSEPLMVTPETFDENTPVVVIEMGNRAAAEVLGVSKVKGGNRVQTVHMARLCVIFRPQEGTCAIYATI